MQTVQDKKEIDTNGYVTYYDVPMTKIGVFPYLGLSIGPELEPDKIYQVLRPKEELTKPETLKSLEAIPFVIDHTMIGEGFTPPEDKGIEGTTLKNVKVKGDLITNDLTAYTDRCKQAIENGKRDLSLGYRCRYDITPGIYQGQPYDAIQRDIRFNHIALVDEGRMGAECRVEDSAIVYDNLDIKENSKMNNLKEEIKEEIKDEILNENEEKIEEKTDEKIDDVIDEEIKNATCDEDKRKLIDEIGGILKDKVDDEIIRTVMQKAEELAYNPSETGANDEDPKATKDCNGKDENPEKAQDEDPKEDDKKEGLSMDEAIKYIAKRDSLIAKVKPLIGNNTRFSQMNIGQIVKYACDKLDIKPSLDRLEGYIQAHNKQSNEVVTLDSVYTSVMDAESDAATLEYINKK